MNKTYAGTGRKKKITKNSMARLAFVLISIALQVTWLVAVLWIIQRHSAVFCVFIRVAAVIAALWIYERQVNAAFKMPWIILILTFPVLGLTLYALLGRTGMIKPQRRRFAKIRGELSGKRRQDPGVMEALGRADRSVMRQAAYIQAHSFCPVYRNTDIDFLPDAGSGVERQIKALQQARAFIFMEYYAIEDAKSFQPVKKILKEKAKQGVDVRILYDDVGSIGYLCRQFRREMEALGISCRVFHPLRPILNPFINNRDHRKIMVVDGRVGFTGGYNLADEYFGLTRPCGQWKDTGVELKGDAVQSLTHMFLEMWNAAGKSDADYDMYLKPVSYHAGETGFVQPYADSPLDAEHIGENVYMNLIRSADSYLYLMTPYLILSDEMLKELTLSAKSGVDVRIVTPGIPDKKIIYQVTRSYYGELQKSGVRIFEYAPGFCHGKQWVCDGKTAVVGSANLDFRSLYLHFEDGVFFYNCRAVKDVKRDFDAIFPLCREVEEMKQAWPIKLCGEMLRLLAPLM